MDVQNNDKDTHEKLGSSSTACPTDNLDFLPIKKRRLRVRSPSPPLQTPSDNICTPHDSTQTSQGIENSLENTIFPRIEDALLTSQKTEVCMDIQSLEKTTACMEEEIPFQKDSICGAHNDSPDQIDSTSVSSNNLDKTENKTENNAEKYSSSAKDVRFHWDLNTVMDEWELPADNQNINSTENEMENPPTEVLRSEVSDKLLNINGSKDSENSSRVLNRKPDIENLTQLIHKSNCLENNSLSQGRINTSIKLTLSIQENLYTSDVQLGQKILSVKNIKLEKQDDILVHPAACVKSQGDHIKSYDVPTLPLDVNNSFDKSEKKNLPDVLCDNVKIPEPVTTLDKCQPVLNFVKNEIDICLPPKAAPMRNSLSLEDPLGDGDVSDISLGGHENLVQLEKITKYPMGYESPFEDGELREKNAISSVENECEAECLNYDIDEREAFDFGTGKYFMSEAGYESIQNENNVNLAGKVTCGSANSVKESSNSLCVENVSGQNEIVMEVEETNNNKTDEMVVSGSISRLDAKGSITEDIPSRETRANLSLQVGESPASGAFDEKDTLDIERGRFGSRFQAGQVSGCDKYSGWDRLKNNWNNSPSSVLESRNHFQNNNRKNGIIPLQRSNNLEYDTQGGGSACRDQRRSTNYLKRSNYQPFFKRRPLDNSDNSSNTHRGNPDSRNNGHGMTRGSSGIYHRGDFRSPKNDNHGHFRNKNTRFSRSRSRTRSPIHGRLQEERNKGHRTERNRIHYDNSKFQENNDGSYFPPRKCFSSQGNSGYFNDRNEGFREKNLPGRFIGQRQRFNSRSPEERTKSDDGFRPERFSKPSREIWRGRNYNDNDNERTKWGRNYDNNDNEKRKYNDRSETICRVSDNNGSTRRVQNDSEDCFDGNNNRNCGWEGRGPFKYDRERM